MLVDHDKSFSFEFFITFVVGMERKEDTKYNPDFKLNKRIFELIIIQLIS